MFENYFELSFLLRFIGMEFNILDFEFFHYISMCDGTFRLYFIVVWIDVF